MKTLVKEIICFVNNNKKFFTVTVALAAFLSVFCSVGTATAAILCFYGIRFFTLLWSNLGEDAKVQNLFRLFCAGGIFFFSGSLLSIFNSFVSETSAWHNILGLVVQCLGWFGMGVTVLFMLGGIIVWGVVPAWHSLVRWAR